MDCDITMPLSLKTIGSAGYRDQSVGLDWCSSQPRGDRGATMEEGVRYRFSLLLPQFFHFLVEMALSGE